MHVVQIQHDQTTGRFHPAYYALAPLPGPASADAKFLRYKSRGHHTTGFETLEEAQQDSLPVAAHLAVEAPEEGFPVREMPEAGVDVLLIAA